MRTLPLRNCCSHLADALLNDRVGQQVQALLLHIQFHEALVPRLLIR
jgi:hypothetical protein